MKKSDDFFGKNTKKKKKKKKKKADFGKIENRKKKSPEMQNLGLSDP